MPLNRPLALLYRFVQLASENFQPLNLLVDLLDLLQEEIPDVLTGRIPPKFQLHEFSNVLQREPESLTFSDEFHLIEMTGRVDAVATGTPMRCG
jgi:hypothetical protein